MKRIVSIILILVLTLGLTACSQTSSDDKSNASSSATSVEWPSSDTVTFVVPASAGGGTDLMARVVADYLSKKTSKNFIISNDTTGNGTVAYETVRNAEPDGNTLLFYHSGMIVNYATGLYQHSMDDFTVIDNGISSDNMALVIRANEEYKTMDEFIAYAKANPDKLVAGIQNGGSTHLMMAYLCDVTGIQLKMVEAGSNSEKITALLGKNIDCAFLSSSAAVQYQKKGDIVILGLDQEEKSADYPDLATFKEIGLSDAIVPMETLVLGPDNMDSALVNKIHEAFSGIADDTDTVEKLAKLGDHFKSYTPEEATTNVLDLQSKLVKAAGLIK